ncbi:alpha/beta-hydrolase [Macrolepiota fuliginosa MF-IS2]|uniref:Alpha/beta-hydrolase n=1 Tax=Macrolepiota fuliginosa MF-IS2 TaxID=1400762 RepID=A0A9P6C1K7_9AGAR|nr:alpha/beta-hydrolase [Macrolepiota fuliginosa MF-IS2]
MPAHPFPEPIELVYKEVDGLSIAMDIYVPENATKEAPAPILLWWHGRQSSTAITPHMLRAPAKHNLCVVSVDYRLAPQTRIPGVLADCKSALEFFETREFAKVTGDRVDASRIIVSGSSAGGWLALLAGTGIGYEASGLEPPKGIKGVIAIYPITDLLDEFWTTKQRPVSYIGRIIEHSEMTTFADPNSEKTSWAERTGKRSFFYPYMLQEAILQKLLLEGTGIEPVKYSIAQNIRTGNFKTPPTYIITGNSDRRVRHQQSLDVVEAYKSIHASVEYHELEGLDHNFDNEEEVEMESMYEFIKSVL